VLIRWWRCGRNEADPWPFRRPPEIVECTLFVAFGSSSVRIVGNPSLIRQWKSGRDSSGESNGGDGNGAKRREDLTRFVALYSDMVAFSVRARCIDRSVSLLSTAADTATLANVQRATRSAFTCSNSAKFLMVWSA